MIRTGICWYRGGKRKSYVVAATERDAGKEHCRNSTGGSIENGMSELLYSIEYRR